MIEEPNTIFSANLKVLRKRFGLSQVQLAKLSGVSRAQISRIENGGFAMSDEIRMKLRATFRSLALNDKILYGVYTKSLRKILKEDAK